MAYSRKHWTNDLTELNAYNLNNIENGIEQALKEISDNSTKLNNTYSKKEIDDKFIFSEQTQNTEIEKLYETKEDANNHKTDVNPHNVTASQVGAYTINEADEKFATKEVLTDGTLVVEKATIAQKVGTLSESEIRNLIGTSGTGSGASINVDSQLYLVYGNDEKHDYRIDIDDISDIVPQNIYVNILPKEGSIDLSGKLYVYDSSFASIYEKDIFGSEICKIILSSNYSKIIVCFDSDFGDNVDVIVSYLTEGGVEKLFDYIDINKLSNLISSGTKDPDETITSQFYFRYSE